MHLDKDADISPLCLLFPEQAFSDEFLVASDCVMGVAGGSEIKYMCGHETSWDRWRVSGRAKEVHEDSRGDSAEETHGESHEDTVRDPQNITNNAEILPPQTAELQDQGYDFGWSELRTILEPLAWPRIN